MADIAASGYGFIFLQSGDETGDGYGFYSFSTGGKIASCYDSYFSSIKSIAVLIGEGSEICCFKLNFIGFNANLNIFRYLPE